MSASTVCGVDGSRDSQAALEVAAQLATRLGSRLVIAHVTEPTRISYPVAAPFGSFAGRYAVMEEVGSQEEAASRLLDEIVNAAGLEAAERHTLVGVPAKRLADLADAKQAELIIVGSRGRGAFKSALVGSVSNSLVGVARCPVLVVPPGATMPS